MIRHAPLLACPAVATLLLVVACADGGDRQARADNSADSPTAGDTASPDPSTDRAAVCLRGGPFVADGAIELSGAAAADATEIGGLRWQAHDGCERFVVDLVAADGSPAGSAGEVGAELLRDLGIVRVSLRSVRQVDQDATDADFEGPLARAAYAVWSPDGRSVYVDLHLAGPAEAAAAVLEDPARVVIDLRPGGGPLPPAAVTRTRVVVLEPRPGAATYPLTVTGYARTFEANVVVRVEQGGQDVHETFTTATAWADAWGHYSLIIDSGPTGPIRLHVGEYSARDGSWEGAVVELDMRS